MAEKRVAVLIGGSDLFSGLRGISRGTKIIHSKIHSFYDEILLINYNYFIEFGRTLKQLEKYFSEQKCSFLTLYGYSKGGEVVMQLARKLRGKQTVDLLVTIDIANGPWSHKINRTVPENVKRNINVFQINPKFPLMSYGFPNTAGIDTTITNIDLTNNIIGNKKVNHSNIEILMVDKVAGWLCAANS